jgi:hypothetical protein
MKRGGLQAGGAEHGLLGEGHALRSDEFLGVDGQVVETRSDLRRAISWRSSRRTTAKVEAVKPCLRELRAEETCF